MLNLTDLNPIIQSFAEMRAQNEGMYDDDAGRLIRSFSKAAGLPMAEAERKLLHCADVYLHFCEEDEAEGIYRPPSDYPSDYSFSTELH